MVQISEAMVNPGETNTSEIIGDNVEDVIPNEGKIYYDIRFRAWAPDRKELIQLIIDVEAQKKYYGIPMTEGMERRVNIMCNLSDIIEERGEAKQIIDNIMSLKKKLNLSVEEACKLLDVSMEQYRTALELIKAE